jgi:GTP-binding protein Era
MTTELSKCGYVAIIGRPNVGKSTLLNTILKQKISIVTRKPQTTREQILGIKTQGAVQTIYIDTPGMHKNYRGQQINRVMNRAANTALSSADVVVFLITAFEWEKEDDWILEKLKTVESPVILAINKMDRVKNKEQLLPFIQTHSTAYAYTDIFPISAKNNKNIDELEKKISELLPIAAHQFDEEAITDRSVRFMVAETIREKVMRLTGEEIPYSIAIEIEQFKEEKKITRIQAIIWVERAGQKTIVIGSKGALLKEIGTQARKEIETLLERKVFLGLFVKVGIKK